MREQTIMSNMPELVLKIMTKFVHNSWYLKRVDSVSANHKDVWNFVEFNYFSSCPGTNSIIEVCTLDVEKMERPRAINQMHPFTGTVSGN